MYLKALGTARDYGQAALFYAKAAGGGDPIP
jgi:TPR repeat protein